MFREGAAISNEAVVDLRRLDEPRVSKYLAIVEDATAAPEVHSPWFRGHRSARWKLQPRYHRSLPEGGLGMWPFALLHHEFWRLARRHVPGHASLSAADRMFVMQHLELPTPLLDWTTSAVAALYFALEELWQTPYATLVDGSVEDACVWILKRPDQVRTKYLQLRHDAGGDLPDGDEVADWFCTRKGGMPDDLPPLVISAAPHAHLDRQFAQQGMATLHTDATPLERWMRFPGSLVKIAIPAIHAFPLMRQLGQIGATRYQLFGGLDALARTVEDDVRLMTWPHPVVGDTS